DTGSGRSAARRTRGPAAQAATWRRRLRLLIFQRAAPAAAAPLRRKRPVEAEPFPPSSRYGHLSCGRFAPATGVLLMIMARSSLVTEEVEPTEESHDILERDHGRRERQLVLLVDDDPHDREIYGRILCYNGFDVICASDGESGMRLALRYHPDVVLLDIGLPDLHGLDLCSSLRTQAETCDIPVVALSAYAEARMCEQARLAGCTR